MDIRVRNKKRVVINPGGNAYEIAVDGVRVVKFRGRFQAIAWCQGRFPAKDIKINDYWDPTFSELPRSPEYKNFADGELSYADARSTIENLYSKLNKLFDTKLSNYAYYKNGDAAVGIPGRSGKLCFVEVDRTVLVKDNPLQINSEIKSLLDELNSLVLVKSL